MLEIDPLAEKIVWTYGDEDGQEFFTPARGSSQRLPNGNTLLAVSRLGEAREVTPEGEVVWKFYSTRGVRGNRQIIVRMQHYPPEWVSPLLAD